MSQEKVKMEEIEMSATFPVSLRSEHIWQDTTQD